MNTQNLYKEGEPVPLHLSSGFVVTFKSTLFNLTKGSAPQSTTLNLFNQNTDIILCIVFRTGKKKIFYSDYSFNPLQGGWGKERSTDLDVDQVQHRGATILVYNFLTDSKINRYQILVNGTTVCYFDSRFSGPVTQMRYWGEQGTRKPILSNPLEVVCCPILDLPPEEQRAIQLGR